MQSEKPKKGVTEKLSKIANVCKIEFRAPLKMMVDRTQKDMNAIAIITGSTAGHLPSIVPVTTSVFVGSRSTEFTWKYNHRSNMDKPE